MVTAVTVTVSPLLLFHLSIAISFNNCKSTKYFHNCQSFSCDYSHDRKMIV